MDRLKRALRRINRIRSIAVLTGSGISAESGISTFRDKGGTWDNYDVEQVATYEGFSNNPSLVWEFYDKRRCEIKKTSPNNGHFALSKLERASEQNNVIFTLCTQNVDGLHHRAGNKNVLELHGNLWDAFCINCGLHVLLTETPLKTIPPKCSKCNNLLRPNVVWFGEPLCETTLNHAFEVMDCDILIVVGTSLLVYPVAYFPFLALRNNALVIEVNIEKTEASDCFLFVQGKAGETLSVITETIMDYLLDQNEKN